MVADELTPQEAERIVRAYWPIMKNAMESGAVVHDVSLLPFPKEKIKQAILIAMANAEGTVRQAHLRLGYIKLGTFQPGASPRGLLQSLKGFATGGMRRRKAPQEREDSEIRTRWDDVVAAEQMQLIEELKVHGF
jgi:hypothetical protein